MNFKKTVGCNTRISALPNPLRTSLILALVLVSELMAQPQQTPVADLSDASLEQLMNVEVTSASKKEQKISKVAAAIYVLNQDDIRRSGATSIPDLLRLVPGVDVAQLSGDRWAVSARGLNNSWSNKLLVLIDGRSVYNPAISGTLWDSQDVPFSDIERIEVIRGPGATVWGANAVNGVINIITKNSRDTTGGLIDVAAGSQLSEQTLAQYGGGIGAEGHYRLFADSTLQRANALDVLGHPGNDPGRIYHFGFRTDWTLTPTDALLVEGDLSASDASHTYEGFYSYQPPYAARFPDTATSHVGSVLARWTRTFSSTSDMAAQFYYDHVDYASYGLHERVSTADFDFQDHFSAAGRHDIVWGLDARLQPSTIAGSYAVSFIPPAHTNWLASAFVQDEIKLTDSLWLTAGTKFEHNDYTGSNLQPSVRALWAPNKKHSVWTAASRALREPSREDVNLRFLALSSLPNGLPAIVNETGNPNISAETLVAYEAGYRFEPNRYGSLDFSAFYNLYNDLITPQAAGRPFLTFQPGFSAPFITIPAIVGNALHGRTYGIEMSGIVNLSRRFKLSPGYSLLRSSLVPENNTVPNPYILQGDAPQHQFQMRSALTLRSNLELDTSLYYVSALVYQFVPSYVRLDVRLGWRISDALEMSFVGQNLTDHHYEYGNQSSAFSVPTYMGRSAYLRGTWHF